MQRIRANRSVVQTETVGDLSGIDEVGWRREWLTSELERPVKKKTRGLLASRGPCARVALALAAATWRQCLGRHKLKLGRVLSDPPSSVRSDGAEERMACETCYETRWLRD